jgi:uncharacterized membrane protein
MYIWKVDQLVEDFKAGKVSQKEEFKYMLLLTLITTLGTDSFLEVGRSYNLYDFITTVSMLIISVLGLYYCYEINSAGDNKNFIARVTCIGLPVLVRVMAIFLPIFFLVGFLQGALRIDLTVGQPNIKPMGTLFDTVAIVVMIISYYVYLTRKIRDVSS